jgi:hypothetical protein
VRRVTKPLKAVTEALTVLAEVRTDVKFDARIWQPELVGEWS